MKKILPLFVVAGLVCGFAAAQGKKVKPHYKVKPGVKIVKASKAKVVKISKPKVVVKKKH